MLPLIHTAVLDACDSLDGLKDGLIDDPRACHFDPRSLIGNGLTAAEATVVQKLHDGATDKYGNRLEQDISHEWGSELDWSLFIPTAQGQHVASENFALSFLRYLADPNDSNPNYQLTDLPLTVSGFWKTVLPSSTYMSALWIPTCVTSRAAGASCCSGTAGATSTSRRRTRSRTT